MNSKYQLTKNLRQPKSFLMHFLYLLHIRHHLYMNCKSVSSPNSCTLHNNLKPRLILTIRVSSTNIYYILNDIITVKKGFQNKKK